MTMQDIKSNKPPCFECITFLTCKRRYEISHDRVVETERFFMKCPEFEGHVAFLDEKYKHKYKYSQYKIIAYILGRRIFTKKTTLWFVGVHGYVPADFIDKYLTF
jgi:hypothetical protein